MKRLPTCESAQSGARIRLP